LVCVPSFPANQWGWVHAVYVATPWLSRTLFVLGWVAWWLLPRLGFASAKVWRRRLLAWLIMAVLGLGLVVDWALKDHVGRARPEHSQAFGGSLVSRPLFEFDQACDLNCSFVSGHAAGGFALMAWGLWAPRRKRQQWLVLAAIVLVGWMAADELLWSRARAWRRAGAWSPAGASTLSCAGLQRRRNRTREVAGRMSWA
jgi:membrane-associated phospholipid phosphatase